MQTIGPKVCSKYEPFRDNTCIGNAETATIRRKCIASQHREHESGNHQSENRPKMQTVERKLALNLISERSRDKTTSCRKGEPFVRNSSENTHRSAENTQSTCSGARVRNRNRSFGMRREMRTVGQKSSPRGASGTQKADRSSEMRPKTETVGQKRSYNLNGNRPGPEVCATPRLPSL